MLATGRLNLLTDVAGLAVGNAEDADLLTGVTVVLCEQAAVAGVDVRGGGPGTRETDLLRPDCRVERIDALALAGGSVFGLQAGDGVVEWLAAQGRGFPIGPWRMPIVPGAIIFDWRQGFEGHGAMLWRDLAKRACAAAGETFALGNAGAGMGATAGRLKGGLGAASIRTGDGLIVGALAVANPVGSPVLGESGRLRAWDLERAGELGRQRPPEGPPEPDAGPLAESRLGANTTLIVVATNAPLDKAGASRVAMMAHDGLARAVRPAHTGFDGDIVFALSTGEGAAVSPEALATIGAHGADCAARAVARGVFEASPIAGIPAYRELHRHAFEAD